jgi:hypothetical protein
MSPILYKHKNKRKKKIPQRPYPIFIILLNKALLLQEAISSQTTSEE